MRPSSAATAPSSIRPNGRSRPPSSSPPCRSATGHPTSRWPPRRVLPESSRRPGGKIALTPIRTISSDRRHRYGNVRDRHDSRPGAAWRRGWPRASASRSSIRHGSQVVDTWAFSARDVDRVDVDGGQPRMVHAARGRGRRHVRHEPAAADPDPGRGHLGRRPRHADRAVRRPALPPARRRGPSRQLPRQPARGARARSASRSRPRRRRSTCS